MLPLEETIVNKDHKVEEGAFQLSSDRAAINVDELVTLMKAQAYWATALTKESMTRKIDGSIVFSLRKDGKLVGFGRIITDCESFGYVNDIVVDPAHRKKGLGAAIVEALVTHPDLGNLKVCRLQAATAPLQAFYGKLGWMKTAPNEMMEFRKAVPAA